MKRPGILPQRGVSLIEALVAMAVMAIGMLGLVGVQSTLRGNSDLAKQRSEAVRLAQQEVEKWRGFVTLGAGGGSVGYGDLADGTNTETGLGGGSASFTRVRTVSSLPSPRQGKSLSVEVSWQDRTGQDQSVKLATLIAGIEPSLAATLTVPGEGDKVRMPQGRNRGIPPLAKDLGGGKSGMLPPGGTSGVAWIFNNTSGLINVCTTTATTTAGITLGNTSCGDSYAMLVSGYLRYALSNTQPPSGNESDLVGLSAPSTWLEVWVDRSAQSLSDVQCSAQNTSTPSAYSTYFCALPVTVVPNVTPTWSGSIYFKPLGKMASSLADTSGHDYKACRYDATASAYSLEANARLNQNFLIIYAGHDENRFDCPSPTWAFLPAS